MLLLLFLLGYFFSFTCCATLYASPNGGVVYFNGGIVQTNTFDNCLLSAQPGDVVQLLPGIYNGTLEIVD